MRSRDLDVPTLIAGLAIVARGTVLLLDRLAVLDLRFGYLWPRLCAAAGAALLASGLRAARDR